MAYDLEASFQSFQRHGDRHHRDAIAFCNHDGLRNERLSAPFLPGCELFIILRHNDSTIA